MLIFYCHKYMVARVWSAPSLRQPGTHDLLRIVFPREAWKNDTPSNKEYTLSQSQRSADSNYCDLSQRLILLRESKAKMARFLYVRMNTNLCYVAPSE